MSKIGTWSVSADQNTATPPDGWPEGMAPSAVNDAAREMMAQIKAYANDAEWFDRNFTPTFVNANSFTVTGDRTGVLAAGRALKLYDASGTAQPIRRFVQTASFTVVTTIALESGQAITSSLTSFATATLSPRGQERALPQQPVSSLKIGVSQSVSNGTTVIFQGSGAGALVSNTYSWYDQTTGRFSPQWPGWYQVNAMCEIADAFSAVDVIRLIALKNGLTAGGIMGPTAYILSTAANPSAYLSGPIQVNGSSDYITVNHFNAGGPHVYASQSWVSIYYLGK